MDAVEEEAKKVGRGPKVSRKRMLAVLAEITQELCQPLSVITCSISMVVSKSLGNVTDPQVDMLKLASESAAKMEVLIDNLEKISGLPTDLAPDSAIQRALYEGG